MVRKVQGVGIMDADYIVDVREYWVENGKRKSRLFMLVRCYSPKRLEYRQSYAGCYVCDEWLTFSNFKAWMETQDWEWKHLDKDLLQTGNKVYSPETCVFVSAEVNSFLLERVSDRGEYPLGVVFRKRLGKYEACCSENGKQKYLGIFQTPEEAHQAWLTYKRKLAKILAEQQDDPRVADALIRRYENYSGKNKRVSLYMDKYIDSTKIQVAPQELQITSYKIGSVKDDTENLNLDFDL